MTTPTYDAFCAAQSRLDDGDYPPGESGDRLRRADGRLTDWYDANVLGPAAYQRMVEDDQAAFEQAFPEPADGARVEWEYDDRLWAAFRQDIDERPGGTWWRYGGDEPHTWRQLVVEHRIQMADLTVLVAKESAQ